MAHGAFGDDSSADGCASREFEFYFLLIRGCGGKCPRNRRNRVSLPESVALSRAAAVTENRRSQIPENKAEHRREHQAFSQSMVL
jgi:hypothetical protein